MDLSERTTSTSRHPWEVVRARFFVDLAARQSPKRVLDVGAGDVYLARALLERAPEARVVAWDREYTDEDMRAVSRDRLEAVRVRPAGPFDLALLLDVLEHVADDAHFLREALSLVAPGGAVIVSVPAWPSLFGPHDSQLRHLRRYTPESARALIEREGLTVERCGGLFHSLLPVRALETAVEVRTGRVKAKGVGAWRAPALVTHAMTAALRADTLVSGALARLHVDAPGLSWWALARKR